MGDNRDPSDLVKGSGACSVAVVEPSVSVGADTEECSVIVTEIPAKQDDSVCDLEDAADDILQEEEVPKEPRLDYYYVLMAAILSAVLITILVYFSVVGVNGGGGSGPFLPLREQAAGGDADDVTVAYPLHNATASDGLTNFTTSPEWGSTEMGA